MFRNINYIIFTWKVKITIDFMNNVLDWYGVVYEGWSHLLWVLHFFCLLKKEKKNKENQHEDTCINPLRALRVQVHDLTPHPTYSLPLALEMTTLFSFVRLCGQNHCGIVWLCALLCLSLPDRQKASSGRERERENERGIAVMKRSQGLGGVPMPSIHWMDALLYRKTIG